MSSSIDAFRSLRDALRLEDAGWEPKGALAEDGRALVHHAPSGETAVVAYVDPPGPLAHTDVSRHLRDLARWQRGQTKSALILYSHKGFTPGAVAAATNRRGSVAVSLLHPIVVDHRSRVGVFAASMHMELERFSSLQTGCMRSIQSAVFGAIPEDANTAPEFSSFSISPGSISSVTILSEGEFGRRRRELIRGATNSVTLATYNFCDPKLVSALCDCALRGVITRCILSEALKLQGRNGTAAEGLRAAGVEVEFAKTHAKCLVVDGRTVIIGSANASDAQYQGLEMNVEILSPELAVQTLALLDRRLKGRTTAPVAG